MSGPTLYPRVVNSRMPMDFIRLMTDTITIQHRTGVNANGESQWGTAIPIRCRVQGTNEETRGKDGMTRHVTGKINLSGVYNVQAEDLLTMPDGTQPPIIAVNQENDERGPLYEIVLI